MPITAKACSSRPNVSVGTTPFQALPWLALPLDQLSDL